MIRLKRWKLVLVVAGVVAIATGMTWLGLVLRQRWVEQGRDRQRQAMQQQQIIQAQAQMRQAVLSDYTDQMKKALGPDVNSTLSPDQLGVMQALTFNAFNQLDGMGKGEVIRFLYRNQLIGHCPQTALPQTSLQTPSETIAEGCAIAREPAVIPLVGANLQEANLRAAVLAGADLQGTDLRRANLRDAQLQDVQFTRANLNGANLSNANLERAHLDAAFLRMARLDNALLGCATCSPETFGASLKNADLQEAQLMAANLGGTTLEGANLQGANLTDAELANADLTRADFSNADLSRANFSFFLQRPGGCSAVDRWMYHVATVDDTDFSNANLSDANLVELMNDQGQMPGATTSGAIVNNAKTGAGPSDQEC